jgi:ring-1,2-phenylacetyl-CoA epoxidase subunit PaaD
MQAPRDARPPAARWDGVPLDRRAVMAALADVPDPEIPAVSIVELGMVGEVEVGERGIRVELLPTFVGCPALEIIRDAVEQRLGELGPPVNVEVSFATPWTSDRISPAGREKLRGSGFAPPPHLREGRALPMLEMRASPGAPAIPDVSSIPDAPASEASRLGDADQDAVACPYCGSTRTTLENVFGPTQCRSIHHCATCRQPFEAFKPI